MEIIEVYRNGFGPAEAEDEEHQGADGVEVFDGIQAKAAQPFSGGVPHLIGHPSMGQLMDDDRV